MNEKKWARPADQSREGNSHFKELISLNTLIYLPYYRCSAFYAPSWSPNYKRAQKKRVEGLMHRLECLIFAPSRLGIFSILSYNWVTWARNTLATIKSSSITIRPIRFIGLPFFSMGDLCFVKGSYQNHELNSFVYVIFKCTHKTKTFIVTPKMFLKTFS